MAANHTARSSTRRMAVYSYLQPLLEGRRVAELRCGAGEAAAHLLALGARAVVAADDDASALERARRTHGRAGLTFVPELSVAALERSGPYDLILVPEALGLLRRPGALTVPALRRLLGDRGRLVCVVPNGDAATEGEGVGYYDLHDALEPHFARVRMFGQTPFAAFGIAEFDEAAAGLRVDSGLVDDSAEQPTHYLAVAGPDDPVALGYALVQVPLSEAPAVAPAARVPSDDRAAEGQVADLRRKLVEAQGQLDGALRVSRAQTEEIEELRARLRRAAEARAELDDETTRLRRGLAEADESVLTLTRRTTEQVTALAQRLTAGLRGPVAREDTPHAAALADRLREQEAKLAARESALAERDERIAALEGERQDLAWRLEAAEENLRHAGTPGALPGAQPAAGSTEELLATIRVREQALEGYRRAAAVHLDEVARLREALTEQSSAVTELEEALQGAEVRLATAEQEAARLRRHVAETEDADRQRRSRLAELEGTLLRLQRQAAMDADRRAAAPELTGVAEGTGAALAARVIELDAEVRGLRSRLAEVERARDDADRRWRHAAARTDELEKAVTLKEQLGETEEALRARISELEVRDEGDGRLDAALGEVDRLRSALERSEEQLWEARGQLLAERDPSAGSGSTSDAALVTPLTEMLSDLEVLENGLRAEAAQLAAVERSLAEWRTALAAEAGGAPPPASSTDG